MKLTTRVATFLILLIAAPALVAQDALPAAESEQQGRLPYEVVVTPNVTISRLKSLLVQIEDDFYDKFNELNLDDAYDVQCYKFLPTGSHIKRRVCEPNFYIASRAENASEILFNIGGCAQCNKPPPLIDTRRDLLFDGREDFEILQGKLENFYRTNREFNSIGEALARIKSRIENYSRKQDD